MMTKEGILFVFIATIVFPMVYSMAFEIILSRRDVFFHVRDSQESSAGARP